METAGQQIGATPAWKQAMSNIPGDGARIAQHVHQGDAWCRRIEQRLDALEGGLSRRESAIDYGRSIAGFASRPVVDPPTQPRQQSIADHWSRFADNLKESDELKTIRNVFTAADRGYAGQPQAEPPRPGPFGCYVGVASTERPPSNFVRYDMRKGELVVRAPIDAVEILELDGWRRIA